MAPTRKDRAPNDWTVMDEANSGFERLVCLFSYHNLDKISISIQIRLETRFRLRRRVDCQSPKALSTHLSDGTQLVEDLVFYFLGLRQFVAKVCTRASHLQARRY